ncbi:hypothetical protein EYC84_000497 [Monilinia fructicola]|uniref:C2H2-type domain-containing protein n=1 Tax=Monilinia fructicola TaxID=38448 RepID=A0A5M9JTM9_MONFR|nr:hypothetical protein EYC84_000497 [Monilinia fructicola]
MAKAHSPKPVFGCVQCTETFESPDAVEKHFSREHGFGCEACPDIFFLTSAARDSHLATCSILLANSDSGDSYQTSRTNFSPVLERKTLPAVGVSLPFKSAQPLIQIDDEPNVDRYHAANQLAQKILSEAKAPPKLALRCKECKAPPFDNKVDFDQHVEHSPFHGPRQLTCHECNMTFETQLALLTHIRQGGEGLASRNIEEFSRFPGAQLLYDSGFMGPRTVTKVFQESIVQYQQALFR